MNGRVKVIKLGGSLLEDASRRAVVLRGIAGSWKHGERIVLVHGGGKHIDAQLAKLGIPKRTHAGLRVTDDVTLPVVVAVLAGTVNKMLVSELIALGIRAAGISGSDGQTLTAEHYPPIGGVNLGHVGRVTKSDPTLLRAILGAAILPVVSSVAAAPNGSLLNVNADAAASSIAVGVGASSLVFLTDVAGLLDENGAVVSSVDAPGALALLQTTVVSGGMRPKLEAALEAMNAGVTNVSIGQGTQITRTASHPSRTTDRPHVAA